MKSSKDNPENKLLSSLLSYSVRIIVAVFVIISISILAIDSLSIVTSSDVEKQREIVERYTEKNMIVFEEFVSDYEYMIEEAADKIEKEISIDNSGDNIRLNLILEELFSKYKSTSNAYIAFESKDMILIPEQELPDSYDPSKRAWYISAKDNGTNWSDIYIDAFTEEHIITLASPVLDTNTGDLLAVVALDIEISELLEKVEKWYMAESDYYTIIDKDGIVLYHPSVEIVGNVVPVEEILPYISGSYTGYTEYDWNGAKKIADISRFEAFNISFVHIEDRISTHFRQIDFAILIILLFGMFLIVALVSNKIKKVRKELTEYSSFEKSSFELDAKTIGKDALKEISSELKEVVSKIDKFS